jgi:hypothetical protein
VARTPADRPIVAAYAVRDSADDEICVGLCGVGSTPVLHGDPLSPPDDFKGSADYRRKMADVVVRRAVVQLEQLEETGSHAD